MFFIMQRASRLLLGAGLAVILTAGGAAAELWPTYRQNRQLTGISPLRGGHRFTPGVRWAIDLGGSTQPAETWDIRDVNGDRYLDLLRFQADALVCMDHEGNMLWEAPGLNNPVLIAAHDFAGDGALGLFLYCDTGAGVQYYLVNGANGNAHLLYTRQNAFSEGRRIGRILPGVKGLQLCVWWSGDAAPNGICPSDGYLWSFENGLDQPNLRFHVSPTGVIYAPVHAFADMDNDGRTDMVMVSHEQLWYWDLASGQLEGAMAWSPQIRTYWSFVAALPLRPGQRPALLIINPHIPGVEVISQNGSSATRLWKAVVGGVEDQYQQVVSIDDGAPNPFMDLNGDQSIEIMAAVGNEHGDGKTNLVIFNADNGARLFDQPGYEILAVDDLDGDGTPETILQQGGALRITNWNGSAFVDRWSDATATPMLTPAPLEQHLTLGLGPRLVRTNCPLWRESEGSNRFLIRFSDGVWSCQLAPGGGLTKIQKIIQHAALGNLPDPDPLLNNYQWSGATLSFTVNGEFTASYTRPQHRVFLAPPPLVGILEGKINVIARNHFGLLNAYTPEGTLLRTLIRSTPAFPGLNHVSDDAIGQICDVDGDGENELVSTTRFGGVSVVAIDGDGHLKQRYTAPQGYTEFAMGPLGNLSSNPADGQWLITRWRTNFEAWRIAAINGKTGEQLWMRDDVSGTFFALIIPTAVTDYNGDGADDLVAAAEGIAQVISVKNNQTLLGPWNITLVVPGHWTAYGTPIVANLLGAGLPRLIFGRSFALTLVTTLAGQQVWHHPLTRDTTARAQPGLADLDGDGLLEVITSQADGLLTAFSASTTDPQKRGSIRWTLQLNGPVGDIATADLDDDGKQEFLIGGGDGQLHAIKEVGGQGTILWSCDFGRRVGSPILADLDEDDVAEILVPVEDGYLYCLESASSSTAVRRGMWIYH